MSMECPVVESALPSPTQPSPMCATTLRAGIFQTLSPMLVLAVPRYLHQKSRCRTMLASVKLLCNKTLLTLCLSFKELSRAQKNSSNLWSAMTAGCQPVVSACNSPTKLLSMLETTLKANTIQTHSLTAAQNAIRLRTPRKPWRFMCESVRHESVK